MDINPFLNPTRYTWKNNGGDKGMGFFFADYYKNKARFVEESKCWYVYNGKTWVKDICGNAIAELAKIFTDYMLDCRKYLDDGETKRIWVKFCGKRMTNRSRNIMIREAASVHPIKITEFDKEPHIFNCQNYTLNLRENTAHKHRPSDFLSKISNVVFDVDAKCERWERFVDEVMGGDEGKVKFIKKALGYAITGDTSHECMFILHGTKTRNGKGTMMGTILHMLGDYGRSAQPESITQKHTSNGSGPSEDIARLKGARFVNISEPEKGLRLNAALVKQMTGNDAITARFLNENSFEYIPEYKLFINTNHKPQIRDDSIFASGRVHLIPFERHFQVGEQDKGLKAFFKEQRNISGILNWCIQGLKFLETEGLEPPESISSATHEYRKESDVIGTFIEDSLVNVVGSKVLFKDVYEIYEKWCHERAVKPMSGKALSSELKNKGLEIRNGTNNAIYIFGMGIRVPDNEIPADFF